MESGHRAWLLVVSVYCIGDIASQQLIDIVVTVSRTMRWATKSTRCSTSVQRRSRFRQRRRCHITTSRIPVRSGKRISLGLLCLGALTIFYD